jgi:acetate kinase
MRMQPRAFSTGISDQQTSFRRSQDTPMVRAAACEGLHGFGLKLDSEVNAALINEEGKITASESCLHAWIIVTEEDLQVAQEVLQELRTLPPSLQQKS